MGTQIGNTRPLVLDLGGNTQNGGDVVLQRRRHDLIVEHLHGKRGGGAARRPPRQLPPVVPRGRHDVLRLSASDVWTITRNAQKPFAI